jgi:poly-gamma-glutamate capsule biosynthesis protein CapA/YwtB (metallophosphatase superfamily)
MSSIGAPAARVQALEDTGAGTCREPGTGNPPLHAGSAQPGRRRRSRPVLSLRRRRFLQLSGIAALETSCGGWLAASRAAGRERAPAPRVQREPGAGEDGRAITLFLCGDVMTGRGIDQILPHPSAPEIHEHYAKLATSYVKLAEQRNGPIETPVAPAYVWGDALDEWRRVAPDLRIVNLETSVTTSDDWLDKGINYRMHPANVPCLTAAGIDACSLANNHVLDWGRSGLLETLETLREAGLASAGAGRDAREAGAPALLEVPGRGRVVLLAFATASSGVPPDWAATPKAPGVNLLPDLSERTVDAIARRVREIAQPRDVVVASIHWGGNWGYGVPAAQRSFARALVADAGVDVVHGHSSHHPKGIEVYRGRLILYGCGDFLSDYEGILGHAEYRSDLCLMYFARLDPASGALLGLRMTPLRMQRFRLQRASPDDAGWLRNTLARAGAGLGTRVESAPDGSFELAWSGGE